MRTIDADELKEHKFVDNKYVQIGGRTNGKTLESINKAYQQGWNDAIDTIIDNAPTVPLPDFKEGYKQAILDGKTNFSRPQGEWIFKHGSSDVWCSVCDISLESNLCEGIKFSFCPNCGAKMKRSDEE